MAAASSVLERDSERSWMLWFTAAVADNVVSVSVSQDGGETFAAPVACKTNDGKPLKAALLDTCQDCRAGGRVSLLTGAGKILVSDDGGLTFRTVV